jgi:hypothetical protein
MGNPRKKKVGKRQRKHFKFWRWAPFGKVPDAYLAYAYNVSVGTVKKKRRKLGIKPFPKRYKRKSVTELRMTDLNRLPWDSLPLGSVHDVELAGLLGVPLSRVRHERLSRGIKPAWAPPKKADLIDWDALPLGKVPDEEIAKEVGVSAYKVTTIRRSKGIPLKRGRKKRDKRDKPRMIPEGLGEAPDAEIGRRYGLTRSRIQQIRKQIGIPSWQETRRKERES